MLPKGQADRSHFGRHRELQCAPTSLNATAAPSIVTAELFVPALMLRTPMRAVIHRRVYLRDVGFSFSNRWLRILRSRRPCRRRGNFLSGRRQHSLSPGQGQRLG